VADGEEPVLLGRQEPTFLWMPPYESSLGAEVCDLAASAGLILDDSQRIVQQGAFAEDKSGSLVCFEVAVIEPRQNGKGADLEAAELAWLFLFGEPLIIHSAHLFETSREHFLRMQARITNYDDLRRRVRRMREGRGSEEIELITGERLKFMTRKGGAGRGFTAGKVVMDEAMVLDSVMMAAGLPTMATIPNAQIWYTGSAGNKASTQLALVRRRGYAQDDPALMLAEWAIDGRPVEEGGDDRSKPATWAKANPGYGTRISHSYIIKEAAAMGGFYSDAWAAERLGVGDWPQDDQAWEVIDEQAYLDASRPDEIIVEGMRVCFAVDTDPNRMMSTIGVCARMPRSGALVVQIVAQQRGLSWVPDWIGEYASSPSWAVAGAVILKTNEAAAVIDSLEARKIQVISPSETEYAQACGRFKQGVEGRTTVHVAQAMLKRAIAGARKHQTREGGWCWARTSPVDIAPAVTATNAAWGLDRFAQTPAPAWAVSLADLRAQPAAPAVTMRRGAAGFAAIRRGP